MRVLLTGASGYLGQALVYALVEAGHEVVGCSRRRPEGCEWRPTDLRETNPAELEGFDVLVHNALLWEANAASDFELADLNACSRIFGAAVAAGVPRILYTSTAAVHRPLVGAITEESPIRPENWYAATKAAAETFLRLAVKGSSTKATVLRPTLIVGTPYPEEATFDRRLLDLAQGKSDDASGARHFTPLGPLARAYPAVLDQTIEFEAYLALDRHSYSYADLARGLGRDLTGPPVIDLGFEWASDKLEARLGRAFDAKPEVAEMVAELRARIHP